MGSSKHSEENKERRAEEEAPIGLTEAFAPVNRDGYRPGVSDEDGSPMGLTEAFAPVGVRYRPSGVDSDDVEGIGAADASTGGASAFDGEAAPERPRGRHARHAAVPVDFDDDDDFEKDDEALDDTGDFPAVALTTIEAGEAREVAPAKPTRAQRKEAKRRAKEAMPTYMKKSRRTRRILTVVVILLIMLAGAGVYFVVQLFGTVGDTATQQAQISQQNQDTAAIDSSTATDATTAEKTTTVPNLTELLGKTVDEATSLVGRGASVSMEREVSEAGSAVVKEVRLSLNDEPADARIGVPTVYLGLNSAGAIVEAGYSASTSSLGYGSLSFVDAVQSEHVIEKTLREAGADVQDGAAVLPEDSTVYSTYGPDGTTLTREYCSFGGTVAVNGVDCVWSAILSYDYNTANATGNLADTVRTVYVYIDSPDAQASEPEEPPAEEAEGSEG